MKPFDPLFPDLLPTSPAGLVGALVALFVGFLIGRAIERRLGWRAPDSWGTRAAEGRLRWLTMAFATPIALELMGLVPAAVAYRALVGLVDIRFFNVGDTPVTLGTVAIVGAVMLASFRFSAFVQKRIQASMAAQGMPEEGSVAAGARLAHYGIVALGLMVGMQTAGVDLSALFAAGAVFAAVIGFAMQTLTQNFVAGVILIVERSIVPGDILELQGHMVRVERMGIRSTVVRDLDDVQLIVPNSELVTGVRNFTMSDRFTRLRIPVGVTYDSDMARVFATLQAAAEAFPERDTTREPILLMTGFGASSVDFEVSVWTTDPFRSSRIKSDLHRHVWDALAAAGITIAFPQLDVHLDPEVVTRLGAKGAA